MHADGIRKELVDCRRALAESNIEREKYVSTNKELRDHIKRVEGQRREQGRNLEEAIQKLVSLEEARVSLENDRTRITTLLKETQNNMTKLNQDYQTAQATLQKMQQTAGKQDVLENELQSRLTNESEERERVQQELQQLKKQVRHAKSNSLPELNIDFVSSWLNSMTRCKILAKIWVGPGARQIKTNTVGIRASRNF